MIAADERTTRIKLATGVISLPYHCPLVVADRLTLLDHLSQGRLIFAAGPGAFPNDVHVLGVDYVRNREHMVASLVAIIDLLTSDEPVNREMDWFVLRDAWLNVRPFTDPCFEIVGGGCVPRGRFPEDVSWFSDTCAVREAPWAERRHAGARDVHGSRRSGC